MLYRGRLLTDDFYSGYAGEGALEVGLSYLHDEVARELGGGAGLLDDGLELQLHVLPLQRRALQSNVFLQQELWPAFDERGQALALGKPRALALQHTTLYVAHESNHERLA